MKKNVILSKILEVLVTIMILLPLLFSVFWFALSWFASDKYKFLTEVYDAPYLPVLAGLTCIVLIIWMILGNGVSSNLWRWLPPFVFFKRMGKYGRALVVILLIIGTLIGLFGELFGIIEPAF